MYQSFYSRVLKCSRFTSFKSPKIKQFSTNNSKSPASNTAGNQTNEVVKDTNSKLKLYAAIASPFIALTVWAVFIINDQWVKEKSEKISPFFVNWIRHTYGFEEENLDENERIKLTNEAQSQDYDVIVKFAGDDTPPLILNNISGDEPYSSILLNITKHMKSRNIPISTWMISSIDFDLADKTKDYLLKQQQTSKTGTTIIEQNESEHASIEDEDSEHISDVKRFYYYSPSLWSSDILNDSLKNTKSRSRNSSSSISNVFDFCRQKFSDLIGYNIEGYENFKSLSQSSKRNPGKQSKTDTRAHRTQYFNELIGELEDRIATLENEMRSGTRAIDDIEAEMKAIKNQITQYKRNHINYFYYF